MPPKGKEGTVVQVIDSYLLGVAEEKCYLSLFNGSCCCFALLGLCTLLKLQLLSELPRTAHSPLPSCDLTS